MSEARYQRRLSLTPRPELEDVITRIARHRGCPKTTVINDFLMDALPVLNVMADALDLAEKKQSPAHILNSMVALSLQKLGEAGDILAEVNKASQKRCPDTVEMPL